MASREPEAFQVTAVDGALIEDIRRIVRAELRRCGLRPPCPDGVAHRWDAEADAWVPTA